MKKYQKILVFSFLILIVFVSAQVKAQTPTFSTHGCAQLVCNPAPDLFSTTFCDNGGACTFRNILAAIIELSLGLSGLIAVAYIIIGGYRLATSGGNEDLATNGRKTLTNAIIGLVIIILSYVIVVIVINAAYGKVG